MMYRVRPPFDVSALAQISAAAALADDAFYMKTLEHNAREKEYLYRELQRRSIAYLPTATNFILINIKRNGQETAERLQEKGIIIRAYAIPALAHYIRLTIGTRSQNDRFLHALDEVTAA
jgi:histidinol-phosphate aminotransferase